MITWSDAKNFFLIQGQKFELGRIIWNKKLIVIEIITHIMRIAR